MAKRVHSFALNKCQKGVCIAEDRISQLPDEVLVYILSFLTVKEAANTSVLSRRWLSLWRYIQRLDFDASKPLDKVALQPKLRKSQMKKYLRWVNYTLQMCKGQRLDQFRVCFDLNKFAQHEIDKWLKFAFSRNVQRLELDLLKGGEDIRYFDYCYTFPTRLLRLGDSVDSSSCIPHSNDLQIPPLVKQNFKFLKVLLLKSVNVTGEVLEFFLHNCPFLETMVVHGSGTLVNLEVVGPSLKLRHLEIQYCYYVKSLKICDTNLVTLRTSAGEALLLKNVPMLVEFDLSQENLEHYNFPQLTKLKKLVFTTFGQKDLSLLGCMSIIRAAPQLKEFELHLMLTCSLQSNRECRKAIKCPLHHLKVVKLCGFYSGAVHLELVRYFLENAIALEKIIFDPRNPILSRVPLEPSEIEEEQTARNLAKLHLEGEVPPYIELVIL
ncbi:FBD-associated F-box protein At2g26860-like isoform X2 [Solanum dulcamara]|uniref:FBD-associated F-box protein At2g26860-like isoform X2 n=1 Tax=Solanum dulcamara TaxID=45834 RepID=UPI0024860F17|nr:FBD-associated F-box protein At2g26860-like isoform X2 [Solanum dulcamara]